MLTDAQEEAGALRLEEGKLTAKDRADLLAAFRLWLGPREMRYPDIAQDLGNASQPIAGKLAGVLILLKAMNFSVTNLAGGRLGVESSKQEKRVLLIEYAFGLLYGVPADTPMPRLFTLGRARRGA